MKKKKNHKNINILPLFLKPKKMGNCLYRYNNSQYSYDHEEIEKYIEQLDERRNR